MEQQRERAARLVASLDLKTTANGCTPDEAASAAAKAAELRRKYGLPERAPNAPPASDQQPFVNLSELWGMFLRDLVAEYMRQRTEQVKRRGTGKKARRRQHAKAVRYRWR